MVTVLERDDPSGGPATRSRPRRWRRVLLALMTVIGVAVGACVVDALRVPGSDSVAAKLAEWGRGHGFNGEVTWLEKQLYLRNQPVVGGQPPGGIPAAAGIGAARGRVENPAVGAAGTAERVHRVARRGQLADGRERPG